MYIEIKLNNPLLNIEIVYHVCDEWFLLLTNPWNLKQNYNFQQNINWHYEQDLWNKREKKEVKTIQLLFSLMGKFALLLMSYWMGDIHWAMSELGPQIKVGQTFRSYWMFATCATWGRIRMYHHAVLERLDPPLCLL